MKNPFICSVCGVPKVITSENIWLDNGTIVQRRDPLHRMVFLEVDNIKGLFEGIERIIGISLERIIMVAQSRYTSEYIKRFMPSGVRLFVNRNLHRLPGRRLAFILPSYLGRMMGYGAAKLLHSDYKNYMVMKVTDPWYLPLYLGNIRGVTDALVAKVGTGVYLKIGPEQYIVTTNTSEAEEGLKGRFVYREYHSKSGDLSLERCSGCGGPMELSRYRWDVKRGIIEERNSHQRMALLGPGEHEAIFDELQAELGEDITQTIIEAQQLFVSTELLTSWNAFDFATLQKQMAFRGMGNLRELVAEGDKVRLRVENPCLIAMLVGMTLGLYEIFYRKAGDARWEVAEDGDLKIEVSPK